MIIYNAKIMLTVQSEFVCSNDFSWFAMYLVMNDALLRLCLLKIKTYSIFNMGIHINLANGFTC